MKENIKKYLRGNMSNVEKLTFEEQLSMDKDLQKEYKFQLQVFMALQKHQHAEKQQEMQARNWAEDLEKQAERADKQVLFATTLQYAAAALFCVLLGGTIYFFLLSEGIKQPNEVKNIVKTQKDTTNTVISHQENTKNTTILDKKTIIPKSKVEKQANIIDNTSDLAVLQHIIEIKQEIGRYQDSIKVITAKKIVGFSGKNTQRISIEKEENLLSTYRQTQQKPTRAELEAWKKERDAALQELVATKQLWGKYKNR